MYQEQLRFPQNSVLHEVNRFKGNALGGGGRALLMEIAQPQVAQAVRDSGFIEAHPFQRLHETLDAGINLTFGTRESTLSAAERINNFHKYAKGYLKEAVGIHPAGEVYDAQDQKLMAWVAATIIDSTIVGHKLLIKDLSVEQEDTYVNEAKQLFEMLNFDPSELPNTYAGIVDYENEMIASEWVKVGPLAKEIAPYMTLSHTKLTSIAMYGVRRLAVYTLPEELKKQFGYTMPDLEKKVIEKIAQKTRSYVAYNGPLKMPDCIKYFQQYRKLPRIG